MKDKKKRMANGKYVLAIMMVNTYLPLAMCVPQIFWSVRAARYLGLTSASRSKHKTRTT